MDVWKLESYKRKRYLQVQGCLSEGTKGTDEMLLSSFLLGCEFGTSHNTRNCLHYTATSVKIATKY
jgi:hypothetical protein